MAQEKLAAKIFDSIVNTYDRFLNFGTFCKINKWQFDLVKNTPEGNIFVDVGTGTGEVVKKINQVYPDTKVVGIDVAFKMLKTASKKTGSRDLFIQASAYQMPFKNNSVDAVLSSLVFRHLDDEKAVSEFNRILKDGGCISILDISKPSKFIYNTIYFFANKIFRPIGEIIFTKEEYDYFMESIENSKTEEELEKLMNKYSFRKIYSSKKFFGMVVVAVFKKVQ
ncbi:class I SAM-dependent methyltransferase [Persephonella sp.]